MFPTFHDSRSSMHTHIPPGIKKKLVAVPIIFSFIARVPHILEHHISVSESSSGNFYDLRLPASWR